ncbi:MAG: OsmC family protein [Bacteroidia bacterium]|nr:OsmC family protein [Bacteroidia bacterium]
MKRKATAIWNGTGAEGSGKLSSTSGVLNNTPYNFAARFKDENGTAGTNPEELIAAAHAGCFSMALSFRLANNGFPATELKTEAVLSMENEGGWVIKQIALNLTAIVPGIGKEKFDELVADAKANCPVSKLLNCEITVDAQLS